MKLSRKFQPQNLIGRMMPGSRATKAKKKMVRAIRSRPRATRTMRSRPRMRRRGPSGMLVMFSAGLGAAMMYFFDPSRGRRRRAVMRDKLVHTMNLERTFAGKATRDLQQRLIGFVARMQHMGSDHPSDDVLRERVRSMLGRHASHPGSIEVHVDDGCVHLRGPILEHEVEDVVRHVRRVRGVSGVDRSELEAHSQADNVPGLQGAGFVPRSLMQRDQWPPAYRAVAIGSGIAMGVRALASGRLGSRALMLGGGLLALRGVVDMPLVRFFGLDQRRRGIDIQKTITIHRPISECFEFWAHPENFSRFMDHVKQVTVDSDRDVQHWKVEGPGGTAVAFDTETTVFERDRAYGWKTLEGATVRHAGIVRFEDLDEETTRIHVQMTYQPPGGAIGHAIASAFRKDPKHALDDDLLRLKSLLEEGKATAHGHEVHREDLH